MENKSALPRIAQPAALGIVLAYCLYFIILSPDPVFPYSSDYTSFLTTAQILKDGGREAIYDIETQVEYQYEMTRPFSPPGGALINLRPPFFALYVLPFAFFEYLPGYFLWIGLSLVFGIASILLMMKELPIDLRKSSNVFWMLAVFSLAFFPIFDSLLLAQTVLFELFILVLVFLLYRKEKEIWAGAALGLVAYKPQLILVFAAFFLFLKAWRVLLGLIAVLVILSVISLLLVGIDGVIDYIQTTLEVTRLNCMYGQYIENQQNWRGLIAGWLVSSCRNFDLNIGTGDLVLTNLLGNILNIITILITGFFVWLNRKYDRREIGFSVLYGCILITSVLASPHAYSHELARFVFVLVLLYLIKNNNPELLPRWLSVSGFTLVLIFSGFLTITKLFRQLHSLVWFMILLQIGFWIALKRLHSSKALNQIPE